LRRTNHRTRHRVQPPRDPPRAAGRKGLLAASAVKGRVPRRRNRCWKLTSRQSFRTEVPERTRTRCTRARNGGCTKQYQGYSSEREQIPIYEQREQREEPFEVSERQTANRRCAERSASCAPCRLR